MSVENGTAIKKMTMTQEQIFRILDSEAMSRYHLTADEFVRKVRAGVFDPSGGASDLIELARLLNEGDVLRSA